MGETRRSPFQRRARLATFGARVASGGGGAGFDLQHMDEDDASALLAWTAPGRIGGPDGPPIPEAHAGTESSRSTRLASGQ